jgi:hypothetical protein
MALRTPLALVGATAMVWGGLTVAVAPPAAAADAYYKVNCTDYPSTTQNILIEVGSWQDDIVIEMSGCTGRISANTAGDSDGPIPDIWESYESRYIDGGGVFTWKLKSGTSAGFYGGPGGADDALFWVERSLGSGPTACNTDTNRPPEGTYNYCGAYFYLQVGNVSGLARPASPVPDWVQAYARSGPEVVCLPGWTSSWDWWPNGGNGGWTCVRTVPAYGPAKP